MGVRHSWSKRCSDWERGGSLQADLQKAPIAGDIARVSQGGGPRAIWPKCRSRLARGEEQLMPGLAVPAVIVVGFVALYFVTKVIFWFFVDRRGKYPDR